MGKNVKIISWNVNGIRQCIARACSRLLWKSTRRTSSAFRKPRRSKARPKSIWQATKSFGTQPSVRAIPVRLFSANKNLYPSCSVCLQRSPRNINLSQTATEDPLSEGRVVAAEFEKFFVVTVYTPNAKDDLSRIPLRHKQWDPLSWHTSKSWKRKSRWCFAGI